MAIHAKIHKTSFAIIYMGNRKLVALLSLSSWYLVIVVWFILAVPWVCIHFVIVVFPDHTHLLYKIIALWIFIVPCLLNVINK